MVSRFERARLQSTIENSADDERALRILEGLVDVSGRKVLPLIETAIEHNEDLERIILMGSPGSGKTTVLRGIIKLIMNRKESKVWEKPGNIKLVTFDSIREIFLSDVFIDGEEKPTQLAQLTPADRHSFAKTILTHIMANPDVLLEDQLRTLTLCELVGVGSIDRGQYALSQIGKRMNPGRTHNSNRKLRSKSPEIGSIGNTLVIHLVADERVYRSAAEIRSSVKGCKNDYEIKIILQKKGIFLSQPTAQDRKRTDLVERYQNMASAEMINVIAEEHDQLVAKAMTLIQEQNDEGLIALAKAAVNKPDNINVEPESWNRILNRVLYAYFQAFHEFGFPPYAFVCVVNSYSELTA